MCDLLKNIEKLHTTEMGVARIKRNLQLETDDVISWCKLQVMDPDAAIERIGKNWYVTTKHYKITINAHSYTVITAHKVR